ncbi:iron ABC transporter permease [Brevibacillus sp. SYP-B805]|uniref:FecCD family ABC transporter permease n=1 Tax=Brevibacillus sp. SYP-B805 TaxID=1578199 RepID=UPI0013ECC9BB|nr:iron ABC transporter permease [Brevibacillus sp. SYP-B805]NGQ96905.1 iron ABC transporter permease [Brevibacillus sp. SYP-B805]
MIMSGATRPNGQRETRSLPFLLLYGGLFALLIAAAAAALFWRVKGLTFEHWLRLFEGETDSLVAYTVWSVRLPRVLLALFLGAVLAVAGCLLQGMTRNDMADPEVIGVNQGASLFVVLGLLFFDTENVSLLILLCAFFGALLGGGVVYILSLQGRYTPARLVLAGLAVSFFFGSLTTGLLLMYDTTLSDLLFWMAGKLSGASWTDVRVALCVLFPAVLCSWGFGPQLNVLALGDEVAGGLGQRIVFIRRMSMLLASVLVGGSVALAGPIGYVGLMVPHMARLLTGPDYRVLIPLSALLGADVLLLADLAGQMLFYPVEIPVGIMTALTGTPFFLFLLQRKRGESA